MRRKDTTKIRLQSEEWFEKNCYSDPEGDWWEDERTYRTWEINKDSLEESIDYDLERYLYTDDCGTDKVLPCDKLYPYGEIIDAEDDESKHWEWCIKEIITKEKYPEEYL